MLRLTSVFVLTALSSSSLAAAPPCDESDLSCIKRTLLDKVDENQRLLRQIDNYKQLDDTSQQQIKNLQESNIALHGALKPVLDAATAAQPKFYQTAWFGLAIGIPVGIVLTLLTVLAARQLVITAPVAAP